MPCAILEHCQCLWAHGQSGAGRREKPAQLMAFPAGSRRALLPIGHMPMPGHRASPTLAGMCPCGDARNGLVG